MTASFLQRTRQRLAPVLAAALLSAGCVAPPAYEQGRELLRQGRSAEALPLLQEAVRASPGTLEYRASLAYARERLLAQRLQQAAALRTQGRLDEAEGLLRQGLAEPAAAADAERIAAELRELDRRRRADVRLAQAHAALDTGDAAAARALLRPLLHEDPHHPGARALSGRLDELERSRPPPEAALAQAYRKPITLEFREAPLRSVFDLLARTAGLNFVFDRDLRTDQKTSVFLRNASIESALQMILLTHQLEMRVLDAHTVLVYPATPAKQKEYQSLVVRSFYLAHAEAKTVAASLKQLLKLREVVTDDKLNLLVVRDSPEAIRIAERVVSLHDLPEPEVMLEVEVLEVKRTRLLELGVRWPDQLSLTPLPATSGAALTLADLRNLGSAGIGAAVGPATFTARRADTDANILANPRIRARNREKARILIGERVPNITTTSTSTGFVAESVNYVDVGLKLEVEPTVHLDGDVGIKVALEVSNIISQLQTKSGSIAYQIGTRTAQTVLRLKDGENQVLAGLISDQDRRSANQLPGLGEVPVLGKLFGSQADDASKTEIVLSITPRVLRRLQPPASSLLEFESGTENQLGTRGVVPAATAPTAPTAPTAQPAQPAATSHNAPAVTVGAATADATTLEWRGPAQARSGDTLTVELLARPGVPVASLPTSIGFDPRVLQVVSVTEGDFLGAGGAATRFSSRIDPSGQVLVTAARLSGATAGAGVLAALVLRVIAASPGETRLQVLSAAPSAAGGQAIAPPSPPAHLLRITGPAER